MPSDDRQLLGSRPGVVACGWLSKEGEGAIARAFPSRRFCCLIEGRFSLEYYKEVTTTATSSAHVNEWNLCLHSSAPSGLAVGDVVVKHQGVPLDGRRFVADSTERPTEVTVLRLKGTILLAGASLTRVGRDRLQVAPPPQTLFDGRRGAYMLISDDEATRDDWFSAIQSHIEAAQAADAPPPPAPDEAPAGSPGTAQAASMPEAEAAPGTSAASLGAS